MDAKQLQSFYRPTLGSSSERRAVRKPTLQLSGRTPVWGFFNDMDFLEKDLEQILCDELKSKDGCKRLRMLGLHAVYTPHVYKQPRIGNYGIADIVTFHRAARSICIYELKNKKVGLSTLMQAVKYFKGIKRFMRHRGHDTDKFYIEIVLIGRDYSTDDWVYLFDGLVDSVSVYKYLYTINGLQFEYAGLEGFKLKKENFNG